MQAVSSAAPPTWNYSNTNSIIPNYLDLAQPAVDQEQVFRHFSQHCLLQNRCVLEVGGNIPAHLPAELEVRKWEAYNLHAASETTLDNYTVRKQDFIKSETACGHYDFIFSCNALHHISPLETAFQKFLYALKPMGIAYLHFGPVWPAPDGHHLDIEYKGIVYRFDGINLIPKWGHLLYTPEQMIEFLSARFEPGFARHAVDYIYYSHLLNRNFFEDYIQLAIKAGFHILHLSTSNTIDYEFHEPRNGAAHARNNQEILAELNSKLGHRNYWTRDILMILIKPA